MRYPVPDLEREVEQKRMSDSFAGYDWGNPIVLWSVRAPRAEFTLTQLAIAERVLAVAS